MLRLLCLLVGLAATVTGTCVAPFKVVGEGCYFYSLENGINNLNWTEARQYCLSLGSEVDLAVLDYVCEDFRNLGTYLRLQGHAAIYTYIGATGMNDRWFWVDGRSFSTDSSYWHHGHPIALIGNVGMALYTDERNNERIFLTELTGESINPFFCQDFSAALQ